MKENVVVMIDLSVSMRRLVKNGLVRRYIDFIKVQNHGRNIYVIGFTETARVLTSREVNELETFMEGRSLGKPVSAVGEALKVLKKIPKPKPSDIYLMSDMYFCGTTKTKESEKEYTDLDKWLAKLDKLKVQIYKVDDTNINHRFVEYLCALGKDVPHSLDKGKVVIRPTYPCG